VLASLLTGDAGKIKDPAPLADSVWQMIWHATKEEPKQCLLTFVEIFLLKFLSDNLPVKTLPETYRFYELLQDAQEFQNQHGVTAIEYYVTKIRPFIKSLGIIRLTYHGQLPILAEGIEEDGYGQGKVRSSRSNL
jgi:hypothetical protein